MRVDKRETEQEGEVEGDGGGQGEGKRGDNTQPDVGIVLNGALSRACCRILLSRVEVGLL